MRVNNPIPAKLPKKSSQKTPTTKKLKKIRCSKLCSQSSNVNEELNQKDAEVPENMETPAIPVNQKEPEGVPESMGTSAFQLIRANQRRSQRRWRPLPFQLLRANQRRSQRPWRPLPFSYSERTRRSQRPWRPLPFQLIRVNQRKSRDCGYPCHSS